MRVWLQNPVTHVLAGYQSASDRICAAIGWMWYICPACLQYKQSNWSVNKITWSFDGHCARNDIVTN